MFGENDIMVSITSNPKENGYVAVDVPVVLDEKPVLYPSDSE